MTEKKWSVQFKFRIMFVTCELIQMSLPHYEVFIPTR